jgi:hypothetical protein
MKSAYKNETNIIAKKWCDQKLDCRRLRRLTLRRPRTAIADYAEGYSRSYYSSAKKHNKLRVLRRAQVQKLAQPVLK